MKRVAIGVVVTCAWVASASALMCYGRGHMEWFVPPYAQWLQAAWWFRSMLKAPADLDQTLNHPLPWFFISAALPSAVLIVWWRRRRPDPTKELLGGSEWAGDGDLSSGKIRSRRF